MGIANIINNSTTTSGGEIIRELVNSSDGQGLHFDGTAGAISLGASMPDLGTQYSLEFVVKGDSKTGETYLLDAYNSSNTKRLTFVWTVSGNIQLNINTSSTASFVATPDNDEVVHLLLSVDGTSATLYKNGNSVSTKTVVANALSGATSSHIGASQDGSSNFFSGTIYRTRFYNRALSSTEVQTAFERADVPVADRYGRQAVTDGSAISSTNWTNGSGWGFGSGKATFTQTGAVVGAISQTGVFTTADVGKKVHITFTVETATAAILIGNASGGTQYLGTGYVSYGVGTHTVEFTMPSGETTLGFWANGATSTISNISVHVEGCVADMDLAFANPTQSTIVRDRSTNNINGTASSSTAVSQVQKIRQLNSEKLFISDLPTSNPGGSNQVWSDSGTLKIT